MMEPATIEKVTRLLGRPPRGLQEIAVSSLSGDPLVLRVSALVEEKPFPTIFWLVDPLLQKKIDQLEATGLIDKLEKQIQQNPEMALKLQEDHLAYIALREKFMTEKEKNFLQEKNYYTRFKSRGIGGISDFSRVRCLHMHYAFHLVKPTTLGELIDHHLSLLKM